MFSDAGRQELFDQLREHDLRVFAKQLNRGVLLEAARRAGLRLWSCPLNLGNLAWLGIAAAWRKTESFVTILTVTLKLLQDQEQFARSAFGKDLGKEQRRRQTEHTKKHKKKNSKHQPYGQDPVQVTEEAFAKARQRMPLAFWIQLILLLSERFEAEHGARLRFRGFRLLAIDGTRLTLPDEQALRTFYGTASNGKGQYNAQARMVLLQSPLTRMPIAYQLQPVKVGEITMARQLACSYLRPDDLLLTATGEEYWLRGEHIASNATHGTGCAFSTALLCGLIAGHGAAAAVGNAKAYVAATMKAAYPVGQGKGPVNHLFNL